MQLKNNNNREILVIDNPNINDFEEVIKLLNVVFSKFPGNRTYLAKDAQDKISHLPNPKIFLIKDKDIIIAFAICYERYPNYYHIWQLGVLEEYRGSGYGKALYEKVEKTAQDLEYKGVTMNTFNKFANNLVLAISRGYKIYGLEKTEGNMDPKILLKLEFSRP